MDINMNRHFRHLLFLLNVGGLTIILAIPSLSLPHGILWGRQYPSSHNDLPSSVHVDAKGDIIVVGNSDSSATVEAATGTQFFIAKFHPNGAMLWRRQVKAGLYAEALAVTTDPESQIYVVGRVEDSLFGKPQGSMDAFIGKWSADGNLVWGRQFGTDAADEADAVDIGYLGQVYVAGTTYGSLYDNNRDRGLESYFIAYSREGKLIAGKQFTKDVEPAAMSTDADNNIYIAAFAGPSTNEPTYTGASLLKYNSLMHLEWMRSPEAPPESGASGVSASGDAIYMVGRAYDNSGTDHRLIQGTYLTRFSRSGKRIWIKVWHRDMKTTFATVTTDKQGNVYTAGYEELSRGFVPWASNQKAIISCLGADGREHWSRSFGAQQHSGIIGLCLSHGHLLAVGFTSGDLFGKGNGCTSLFLAEVKR